MKGDAWLGTYGDMITLMLCFFVLLFAMSNIDSEKFTSLASSFASSSMSIIEGGGGEGMSEMLGNGIMDMPVIESTDKHTDPEVKRDKSDFEKMASDFKTYFAENSMSELIEVTANEDSMNITFKDGVLFDSGSASIRQDGLSALDFIANELIKYPDMNIEITGHTDNVPIGTAIYPDNWYLSAARAISVCHYLVDEKGFSPLQVLPIGRGEYMPIAPNDTAVNRAKNRRVEIEVRKADGDSGFYY